jgi:hypothetical protein
MAGATASWIVELMPAEKVTVIAPRGTSASTCSGSDGAAAASNSRAPKPAAAPTRIFGETRPRAPLASAPATDPTAIAAVSRA